MKSDAIKEETLSYLTQIQKHLWLHKDHGKAAVMVGSGFSRNAVPGTSNAIPFPLWRDLAQTLHESLSPGKTSSRISSPMVLAGEYEARFGRMALNRLLASKIPDGLYDPGPLHARLLELPWADVFTTNYDTLLERTTVHLPPERDYTVVRTITGIAGSSQPRITKLHGSFPEHFPLIVTKDDYKTYRTHFAPFVNMVQQSMMENVFCLVGFSGDDPNFLEWMKWVRDNLKETAPTIYLCDVFSNPTRSQSDHSKFDNVKIVDLSVLGEGTGYQESLAAFFRFLKAGKPADVLQWGARASTSPLSRSDSNSFEFHTSELKRLREGYPGWVVCPQDIRDGIWERKVKPAIRRVSDTKGMSVLSLDKRIEFLRECTWGLNTCLCPPSGDLLASMDAVIGDYLDSPEGLCKTSVVEMVLAIIKASRESMDKERFQHCVKQLENLLGSDNGDYDTQLRLHYEKCLWAWYRLNLQELETLVATWPKLHPNQFWETKRASMLLILGHYEKAWAVLEATLLEIRRRLHRDTENVELMSQESWTMFLLSRRHPGDSQATDDEYRGRWKYLARYGCDARFELAADPTNGTELASASQDEHEEFDYGRRTTTIHMGDAPSLERDRRCRAFLRLYEEVAYPVRFGIHIGDDKSYIHLFPLILASSPYAALSLAARLHLEKVTDILSRFTVMDLPHADLEMWAEDALPLFPAIVARLNPALRDSLNPPPWYGLLYEMLEILSRLTLRLSRTSALRVLELMRGLYCAPAIRSDLSIYSRIRSGFERCLDVLSDEDVVSCIPDLLDLPLGDAQGSHLAMLEQWPEPFWNVTTKIGAVWKPTPDQSVQLRERVAFLISQIEHGSKGRAGNRVRAIQRMSVLSALESLTEEELHHFAAALWKRTDSETGLPEVGGAYYPHVVLRLPESVPGQGDASLKQYLLGVDLIEKCGIYKKSGSRTFPPKLVNTIGPIVTAFNASTLPKWQSLHTEYQNIRIQWSSSEARRIICDVAAMWNNQKEEIRHCEEHRFAVHMGAREVYDIFLDLSTLMTKTMLPYVTLPDHELAGIVRDTLSDMLKYGVAVQRNCHMLFFLSNSDVEWISNELAAGIRSPKQFISGHSFVGVADWAYMAAKAKNCPRVPDTIRRTIVGLSLTLDTKAADTLLRVNAQLLTELPDFFSLEEKEMLVLALRSLSSSATRLHDGWYRVDNNRELFVAAHKLAAALYSDHERRGEDIPEELSWWKSNMVEVPLPEVREAWGLT